MLSKYFFLLSLLFIPRKSYLLMYRNLPLRKILWLSELVGLSRQRYLSSVVSSSVASPSLWHLPWATRRMTHVPQNHSDAQSRYVRSTPLFLEHSGKVQRGQKVKQSKAGTGAGPGCSARLPGLWPDREGEKGFPDYVPPATAPLCIVPKLFHRLELASSYCTSE